MAVEEKATAAEVVVKAMKEEAAQVIMRYKTSVKFENEVSEAVCDAFYKDFDKCKRKVVQTFHLQDLKDIVADELEEVEGGTDTLICDDPIEIVEVAELETDPAPQVSQAIEAATRLDRLSLAIKWGRRADCFEGMVLQSIPLSFA